MNRRNFLTRTTALAGLLPSLSAAACSAGSSGREKRSAPGGITVGVYALDELSLEQLQAGMQEGRFTSRSLVEGYLEKINDVDRKGVKLNSVLTVNPDALSLADQSDRERKEGRVRSALHGIPFLVKDNIDTGDRMMTTAGSAALYGHYARADAPLVKQLREAGAVLLGKANLSEWANFRSTRSSSGWSSLGGQTRNPYVLGRNPCGSSAGSGVAVAASLCGFAIGTETNGSISCPASINGVVGVKPTVGLVSRSGIIPISHSQDTAGPMTRTVREAALVLSAMAGPDADDAAMTSRPPGLHTDYAGALEGSTLKGKRIGVERSFLKLHEAVDELLKNAIRQMEAHGATVVEVDHKERLRDINDSEFILLQYEFKEGLNRYLHAANAPVRSLGELIAFNRTHAARMMPYFGQEILEASEARGPLSDEAYGEALKTVISVSRQSIDSLLEAHDLDALCGPAAGPAWCTDLVNGDAFSGYGMGAGAAMAGYPAVTVPLGTAHGLPVGLLFMGGAWSEARLLSLAYAYEQVSRNRKAPDYRKALDDA